jgi:peptidoglycan/LPS O-acetylase OafA/YrhL
MWPRITELFLAVWLVASQWIVPTPAGTEPFIRTNALTCAALIALFALLSFRAALEKAHLLTLVVALWLIVLAFLQPDPPPPAAYQNFAVTGLTLLLFAILPSRASDPPRAWREFWRQAGS